MKIKTHIYILIIVFFSFTSILAQNNKQKKNANGQAVVKEVIKENGTGNIKTPQSTGDEINFKDEDGNSLITITDEGTTGSITIPSAGSVPSATTNKLYNVGSTLYFNGISLGSGGATSINDLSDAKSDGTSVFLGSGAGANDVGSSSNTALGINALNSNTSGSGNVAVGLSALRYTSGIANTGVGYESLMGSTTPANNTGEFNSAIGYRALWLNTSGDNNTATGYGALYSNTTGSDNSASGYQALYINTTGHENTAIGFNALFTNTTGIGNTAVGEYADVTSHNLTNATAIGYQAKVDTSNKIRLGNSSVSVIEGQVPYTYTSDSTKKENFLKVDGEKVLEKFRKFKLTSWNYKGNNPKTQRHYGIMAQVFFSAFGHDAIGTMGNDTTLNGGDVTGINMIAIQALEKRTTEQDKRLKIQEKRIEELEKQNKELSMQDTEIKSQDAEIKKQNIEIKNEFGSIRATVNKLVNGQDKVNVTYK